MRRLKTPTVAAVNGLALGGGFGLVLGCDLAVAADDARMGTPEVKRGLFPMMIAALIDEVLPRKAAMELMLTGGEVSGANGALTATALSTTLTITDARPSDAGEYTVVFTNSCGAATSVAAAVAITTPCPADLTGDGLIGSADLGVLLNAWGTKGSPADLTGDGSVDSADLAALLSAWGVCG
jgi:1,4-dihydroxy-2-naphthoyl-CoA synthase